MGSRDITLQAGGTYGKTGHQFYLGEVKKESTGRSERKNGGEGSQQEVKRGHGENMDVRKESVQESLASGGIERERE